MIFRREVKEEPKPARRRFVYREYYRQAQFSAASRLKSKKNICAPFAPVPKGEIRCNFHGRVTHVRLVSVFITPDSHGGYWVSPVKMMPKLPGITHQITYYSTTNKCCQGLCNMMDKRGCNSLLSLILHNPTQHIEVILSLTGKAVFNGPVSC